MQDQWLVTASKLPPTKGLFVPVSRAVLVTLPDPALPLNDRLRREMALSAKCRELLNLWGFAKVER